MASMTISFIDEFALHSLGFDSVLEIGSIIKGNLISILQEYLERPDRIEEIEKRPSTLYLFSKH